MNTKLILLFCVLLAIAACQHCPECPTPTEALQFQVVDILGRDLTTGTTKRFEPKTVRLTYTENETEKEIPLKLDTLQERKTIFIAKDIVLLANRGLVRYQLYLSDRPDTLDTSISFVNTVCCNYKVLNYLNINGEPTKSSLDDEYVFWIQK